jgi:hypothetical protein
MPEPAHCAANTRSGRGRTAPGHALVESNGWFSSKGDLLESGALHVVRQTVKPGPDRSAVPIEGGSPPPDRLKSVLNTNGSESQRLTTTSDSFWVSRWRRSNGPTPRARQPLCHDPIQHNACSRDHKRGVGSSGTFLDTKASSLVQARPRERSRGWQPLGIRTLRTVPARRRPSWQSPANRARRAEPIEPARRFGPCTATRPRTKRLFRTLLAEDHRPHSLPRSPAGTSLPVAAQMVTSRIGGLLREVSFFV